ncbi:hypothetical protein V6N13_134840 [Hibiscus sabdariffa]|uniref:Uncharacterized protein n=1 Tax=Hibiscus sabdariffa TaxID=183260 RepID=A0ABR2R4Z3_9ROSI
MYGLIYEAVAGIAQLGERQTEDLKVACSIHAHRNSPVFPFSLLLGSLLTSTRKYVLACAIFASLNNVLLRYDVGVRSGARGIPEDIRGATGSSARDSERHFAFRYNDTCIFIPSIDHRTSFGWGRYRLRSHDCSGLYCRDISQLSIEDILPPSLRFA